MIKLFNKNRKKYINEGYMGKYLKYAFGEILLVVVGILIALQVNNWNEHRKDKIKEKTLLKEIHKEFTHNLNEFLPVKQSQLNTFNSGSIVFRNINKLDIEESRDSVFKYATGMFGGYPYHPSNGVVESLISSGEINLIKNDSLRSYLISWKDVLKKYTEYVNIDIDLWSNIIQPYIFEHGSFINASSNANKKLLTDPVFINMLYRKQFFNKNIITIMNSNDGIEYYLKEIVRLSK